MGKWRYGVILDAGSSGTRLHIYRWYKHYKAKEKADEEDLRRLPRLETKKSWTQKTHPGISTFSDKLDRVGPDHLAPLFEHALSEIPNDEVENTPLFLLATAGVRLLLPKEQTALLANVCEYARKTTNFQLPDCALHVQAIPGETEGLYGWIAANYLLGGFDNPEAHDHGKSHHTYGFLDMGGASAQMAFAPNATEAEKHANDLTLVRLRTVDGTPREYRVFVTTWLGYGVREARRRYVEALLESTDLTKTNELPDPCLPKGLRATTAGGVILEDSEEAEGDAPHLLGTGKFKECLAQTFPLLDKDAPCTDPPCLLHGVHVPQIDFDVNHFVGVSEYWHTTHEIFEMGHKDRAYDFQTYQERVRQFCEKDWASIRENVKNTKWGSKVDETTAEEVCFKASWLINMLHDGIGVPRVGFEAGAHNPDHNTTKEILDQAGQTAYLRPFQAVNKIDENEVSWTLGKMVLYAASEVPPISANTLAVGFGSNVAGIPSNFEHGGGNPHNWHEQDDLDDIEDGNGSWQDKLLNTSSAANRTPGFIFFIIIVVVVALLLCGRNRRANLSGKVSSIFHRRGGSGSRRRQRPQGRQSNGMASKLPFGLGLFKSNSGGSRYERLMEEGDVPHPSDFELTTISSSDDELDSRSSKGSNGSSSSSGRGRTAAVTPRKYFPGGPSGLLDSNFGRVGLGIGLSPPRSADGAGQGTGHRSRNTSPTRWRSPVLSPLKESVD